MNSIEKNKILKEIRQTLNSTLESEMEERLEYYQEYFEIESNNIIPTAEDIALSSDPEGDHENHIWMDGYCQAMNEILSIIKNQ